MDKQIAMLTKNTQPPKKTLAAIIFSLPGLFLKSLPYNLEIMWQRIQTPFVLIALFASGASAGFGGTVINTNDSGPGSLRDAIAATPRGGTVAFALDSCPCTIVLTTGDLAITRDLTIIGPGADQLTISGNNAWRPFRIGEPYTIPGPGPATITVVLDGLTMTNGVAGAWPSFSGLNGDGGGLISVNANLTIRNSNISNNFASRGGGGISSVISNTTITNTVISGNRGQWGGGISHVDNSSLSVVDSIISDNRGGTGGAIYSNFFTRNYIINSAIARNQANFASAAYIFQFSTTEIVGSTIEGNYGGGTLVIQITNASITNSTISGNTSTGGYNAGIAHENFDIERSDIDPIHSQLTITNTTITNNRGSGEGDGITTYHEIGYPSTTTVRNSIIAGNGNGPNAAEIISRNGGIFASSGHNLIGNTGTVTAFNQPGDIAGVPGSPIDPRLEPLAFNGGPTRTHGLIFDSPAIDRGFAFGFTTDQRGLNRPVDNLNVPNAAGGDGSDIGALEAQQQSIPFVAISGRVTTPAGLGLRNVIVAITDSTGFKRTAVTSTLGFYSFSDIRAGDSLAVTALSKRYRFQSMTLITNESLTDVDLVGIE